MDCDGIDTLSIPFGIYRYCTFNIPPWYRYSIGTISLSFRYWIRYECNHELFQKFIIFARKWSDYLPKSIWYRESILACGIETSIDSPSVF
jgi:hypothetical protein